MRKLSYGLTGIMLTLSSLAVPVAMTASDTPSKNVWALLGGQIGIYNDPNVEIGIVNYDLASPQTYTMVQQNTSGHSVGSAFMLNGVFYWYEYKQQLYGYDAIGLFAYDTEDGSSRLISSYGGMKSGPVFSSGTYDYQSDTVYGLRGLMGGPGLVTIDSESGEITQGPDFTGLYVNEEYDYVDVMKAIAVNYDGDMYGVSYWGKLYKISPMSGECTIIADLDFNPDMAIMYQTFLAFDNDTNELYWSVYTNQTEYDELRKIDITNGTTEQIGIFANDKLLNDFYIPFTVAEAGAPAKVNGLTITPDSDGAMGVTLSWTNPSRTYGRGGTLEELLKIEVYRNNELVKTIDSPEIGGEMSVSDEVPASDLYSYKVVPYNTAGKGDRSTKTMFVGQGIPMPVTNLVLHPENHGAKLTWDAPESGKFNAYLDRETLCYEITRSDGVVVSSDCKETEFFDSSIDKLARLSYVVKAKNIGGESIDVVSNDAICGPSIEIPYTFDFPTEDEFFLWNVIDGNGNGLTWNYVYWPMTGAQCKYSIYDNYAAHDYMISPKVAMKAGQNYKVTFDAMPGNKNVTEVIAISFGDEPDPMRQDSVAQFEFRSNGLKTLRANLPVVEKDGEYNFGFVYRSWEMYYDLTIGNIRIEENHDGNVEGIVTSNGKPVAGAEVVVNGGQFVARSDDNGKYCLEYLPQGAYEATVSALGYSDKMVEFEVKELTTITSDISIEPLPKHKLYGKVEDSVGDPVGNANVTIGGYCTYNATTSADGSFEIDDIFEKDAYSITIERNNLLSYSSQFDMNGDLDLGTLVLNDNLKSPHSVSVTDNGNTADVEWTKPLNDPIEYRYDDGGFKFSLGINSGTSNTLFGNINRTPSVVYGASFFLLSTPEVPAHYSVELYVLDLDENGNPTDKVLYHDSYVTATDDAWTDYTLSAPVDCPNGYFVGLSYYGFLSLAIDGSGDTANYPFVPGVNCYTSDYTTGEWAYLDDTDYRANFAIRSLAAPYELDAPMHKVFAKKLAAPSVLPTCRKALNENLSTERPQAMKAVEDRVRYNVYRAVNSADTETMEWKELATNLKEREYSDAEWATMPRGVYRYGVKAIYANNEESPIAMTDSIGKDMRTRVVMKFTTDTPDNEAEGAAVSMNSFDGMFNYDVVLGADGVAEFNDVWKGQYTLTVAKEGFVTMSETLDLTNENSYEFAFTVSEERRQPENLQVIADSENDDERLLVWNFPSLLFDGFEDHKDFEINSEGKLGWQYIDGDGLETGAFSNYSWPNAFAPMAWIVFNPYTTEPLMGDYNLYPYEGDKMLASFASYGEANDDWIISPCLYFTEDFLFNFFVRSYSYSNPETLQIGYSLTGTEPEDFIMVEEALSAPGYWMEYSYNIPANARYVAIRNISNQRYIAMIDNLRIGTPEMIASNVRIPETIFRGVYEVFLDGEKMGETKETNWLLSGLQTGSHIAGVRGSYKSGYSETTYTPFDIVNTGVESVSNPFKVTVDGGKLVLSGNYDFAELYSVSGLVISVDRSRSSIELSSLAKGVYILSVSIDGKKYSQKVTI